MDLVIDRDYKIVYENLPCRIKGFVTENLGFFTIVVNLRHSAQIQEETIRHELEHIRNGDFERFCVDDIENDMR